MCAKTVLIAAITGSTAERNPARASERTSRALDKRRASRSARNSRWKSTDSWSPTAASSTSRVPLINAGRLAGISSTNPLRGAAHCDAWGTESSADWPTY